MNRRAFALLAGAFASGCFPMPVKIAREPQVLDAKRLVGEWYVSATNFPMWIEGDRKEPRFRYSNVETRNGIVTMHDEISIAGESPEQRVTMLQGTNLQDPDQEAHFTWRGGGLLHLVTSEWYVARLSDDATVALIFFTETIATPAGVDVITREANPGAEVMRLAERWIAEDGFLREQAQGLVWLRAAERR